MCNNAPSLSLNRTAIVERRGDQTAEPLLVTAVLHLPQPDTRAALEHHFISAGGDRAASADSKLVWAEGNFVLSLSEGISVCSRSWAPVLFDFCWLNLSLTCVLKTNVSPDSDLFARGKGVLT